MMIVGPLMFHPNVPFLGRSSQLRRPLLPVGHLLGVGIVGGTGELVAVREHSSIAQPLKHLREKLGLLPVREMMERDAGEDQVKRPGSELEIPKIRFPEPQPSSRILVPGKHGKALHAERREKRR